MPTAAKLVAGAWFGMLAWFAAELAKNHMPDGTQFNRMSLIAGIIGLVIGWLFAGKRAGDTMRAAYGYGFTAALILAFWCVFYFSGEEMLMRAWDTRYKGPMAALIGMMELFRDYALIVLRPDIAGTLVLGGLFGGWITEKTARRWS